MPGTSLLSKEWNAGLYPAPSPCGFCLVFRNKLRESSFPKHRQQRAVVSLQTKEPPRPTYYPTIVRSGKLGVTKHVCNPFIYLYRADGGAGWVWDCLPVIPGGRGGEVTSYNPARLQETCLKVGEIGSGAILAEEPTMGQLTMISNSCRGESPRAPGKQVVCRSTSKQNTHMQEKVIIKKPNKSKTGLRCLNV